ncbi:hypothetical protein J6590_039349 [Homalodisca vitripennis]|nr:hypothetical protein J6590_039348 [Homalodisca vitripennis]KAG8267964.1 hypothetical protein J6590_039349 [Homalodisca vitripennis]
MFLPELYKPVQIYNLRHARYALDKTVQLEDHDILRLPLYHPDLNPLCNLCKGYVAKINTSYVYLKLFEKTSTKKGCRERSVKCMHVEKIEKDFAAAELQIDNIIEFFIILAGDGLDTDSSDSSSEEKDHFCEIKELQGKTIIVVALHPRVSTFAVCGVSLLDIDPYVCSVLSDIGFRCSQCGLNWNVYNN